MDYSIRYHFYWQLAGCLYCCYFEIGVEGVLLHCVGVGW